MHQLSREEAMELLRLRALALQWSAGLSEEKKGSEAQEIPRWLEDIDEAKDMHPEVDR
jgi:hypothetical protein